MKINVLFLLSVISSLSAESGFIEKYESSGGTAVERWETIANEAPSMPPDKRIEYLSHVLISDEDEVGAHMIKTYKRIQRILLDTPGHAEYFGNQLKQYPKHTNRDYWFQYLENLPSTETVGVLGEMLVDDRARPVLAEDKSNLSEYAFADPNCDRAAVLLQKMLANPPIAKESEYEFARDLPTWRHWFELVKAGNQTFRFVGDDTEYTLRGPSKRGAIAPGTRNTKRNSVTPPDLAASMEPPPRTTRYLPYLIGGLFLLAGYVFYMRRKRNAA